MKLTNLSWADKFSLIDEFKPSSDTICKTFRISVDELQTAQNLRSSGKFVNPKQSTAVVKYGNIFNTVDNDNLSIHELPQTATKRTIHTTPRKRGRKGTKIISALRLVPETPVLVDDFSKQHDISVAVLRQAKRFISALPVEESSEFGSIIVKQDKQTKQLMIWKEGI
jgi:hypothetical protein